ncbi:MAG: hypothetical protein L0Z62_15445 [Gemmataceae bacterium]|nr:hypothetical protein [Gemmataceae bacterium]
MKEGDAYYHPPHGPCPRLPVVISHLIFLLRPSAVKTIIHYTPAVRRKQEEEGDFASRLLRAKRRAMEERERDKGNP